MIGAALLTMAILGTLGGFFLCWPLAIAYWLNTGHLLAWRPRRHVPWNFLDLLVVVLLACSLLVGIAAVMRGVRVVPPNPQAINVQDHELSTILDAAWKLAVMGLATLYLWIRAGVTWRDLGWSGRHLGEDVLIGIITFVMIAPPVYAIQALIVWYGKWKYEHPLIDMLQKTPNLQLFGLLAFSACIMAPLSEEWFFRVLVQGWLERAFAWLYGLHQAVSHSAVPRVEAVSGTIPDTASSLGADFGPTEVALATHVGSLSAEAQLKPHAVSSAAAEPLPAVEWGEEARAQPWPQSLLVHGMPILISSLLFGLAHFGHGPAPITLTFLALGLGYVYQRTHSIVPVMVVHALFNSVSVLLFYVYMFELKQPLPQ